MPIPRCQVPSLCHSTKSLNWRWINILPTHSNICIAFYILLQRFLFELKTSIGNKSIYKWKFIIHIHWQLEKNCLKISLITDSQNKIHKTETLLHIMHIKIPTGLESLNEIGLVPDFSFLNFSYFQYPTISKSNVIHPLLKMTRWFSIVFTTWILCSVTETLRNTSSMFYIKWTIFYTFICWPETKKLSDCMIYQVLALLPRNWRKYRTTVKLQPRLCFWECGWGRARWKAVSSKVCG